jgi:hypothetical protein
MIGLEIAEALPDVESVLVPLSGGGLAAGVAVAIKAMRPKTRVIGVSMARGAAMHASLAAGRPVEVEEVERLRIRSAAASDFPTDIPSACVGSSWIMWRWSTKRKSRPASPFCSRPADDGRPVHGWELGCCRDGSARAQS